jgi:hypothetical protein
LTEEKLTLGQAIDRITTALTSLESNARIVALNAVCDHLQISLSGAVLSSHPKSPPAAIAIEHPSNASEKAGGTSPIPKRAKMDIRTLKDQKNPQSAQQMACVVAFYLSELAEEDERADSVSTPDLEKYFKQAGYKLPEHISQVLKDAKRAGYFDSAERGRYRLNAVGYNLVAHGLPAGGA